MLHKIPYLLLLVLLPSAALAEDNRPVLTAILPYSHDTLGQGVSVIFEFSGQGEMSEEMAAACNQIAGFAVGGVKASYPKHNPTYIRLQFNKPAVAVPVPGQPKFGTFVARYFAWENGACGDQLDLG